MTAAVDALRFEGIEARGAVFTRREVVDFILDLANYKTREGLWRLRVLEPSAGVGAFLLPVLERMLASYRKSKHANKDPLSDLADKVRAVEVHRESFTVLRERVRELLRSSGLEEVSEALCNAWLVEDDFLLADLGEPFNLVVGNPPYVRQELIPDVLLSEYKLRYRTIFDRADLYVPFIERSLTLLQKGGRLAFICSDRWMKNRYGQPLRRLIAEEFSLEYHVDMVGTDAFEGEVSAYPAITVIAHEKLQTTKLAHKPKIESKALGILAKALSSGLSNGQMVHVLRGVAKGTEPWILDQFDELAVVRELEERLPLLEEVGCKVGIGVATGADKVFIGLFDQLPVEPCRKQPLVMAPDIRTGVIEWSGHGVVNPFGEDGKVVPLDDFPLLKRYFLGHEGLVRKRNVAKRNPNGWYRTIDRIYPELTKKPKLLIPDIKGEPSIVFDEGNFYPHHNLYFVTSEAWPLPLLQVILRSTFARLFVELYSVRMRGGYLRFQAQYLRRIRIPAWETVPKSVRRSLERTDPVKCSVEEADVVACAVYGVEPDVIAALRRTKKTGVEP